jgi:hypothetical protein
MEDNNYTLNYNDSNEKKAWETDSAIILQILSYAFVVLAIILIALYCKFRLVVEGQKCKLLCLFS